MPNPTPPEPSTVESLPERAVAGLLRTVLRAALRPTFRAGRPIEQQRRRLERIARLLPPPRGVEYTPGRCGGIDGEYAESVAARRSPRAILYLHGGAYCVGSPRTHRTITGTLARLTGARVFAADYRLAPEHPFPAAVEDAVAAWRGLLVTGLGAGQVAIAGDSAGGGLALAAALSLRDRGEPLPAALVTFSPWVDLAAPRGPVPTGEVMISPEWTADCAQRYVAGGEARHPLASPLHADLRGLPPTLVQVGTDEVLLADSQGIRDALRAAGVDVHYEQYARRWHVFQANAGLLADADRALERVARFLGGRWAAERRSSG
jgi:acetyl esterase/lipase